MIDIKKEGDGYLRFLNSINSFGVVAMYANPFSISSVASLALVAVLQVYSSLSFDVASCAWISVCSIFLCPICCLTYSMSLVFAYSLVPKWCLKW